MKLTKTTRFVTLFAGLFLAFSMVAVDHADARRGGSFGSRGMRTSQPAPPTRTAPDTVAPVDRSMTPSTAPTSAARPGPVAQQRPGFMNGFGGSMLRGLMLGGLIGLLLGQGFGGLAGMFGFLLQALLIGGAIWLVVRLFRSQPMRSQEPAMAGAAGGLAYRDVSPRDTTGERSFGIPNVGSRSPASNQQVSSEDITLEQADLEIFQRLLTEVQEAFGREDHAGLRRLVTPEMVSFLSEELADNAQKGLRNEVSDVHLNQADVAESWREGEDDYATAALQYSSRDVTVDRASGRVVQGSAGEITETTELWTFVRPKGGDWKLSAIQEA